MRSPNLALKVLKKFKIKIQILRLKLMKKQLVVKIKPTQHLKQENSFQAKMHS
jgi:hypothetical protein